MSSAAHPTAPTCCAPSRPTNERNLSFDSPFDHFVAGDKNAIDDAAKRGWELFNTRGRCNKCHALTEDKRDVTNFTDNDFHNIGIGIIRHNVVALARQAEQLINSGDTAAIDRAAIQTDMSALGRFLITKKESDIASFKTPNLRNILVTGPYFHDGSQQTLWDVSDHYNKGAGLQNPYLDEDIQPLALTEGDIDDLVAFLASLTSARLQGTGRQGAGAPARELPDGAASARYGEGLRPETASAQVAAPLMLTIPPARETDASSSARAQPIRRFRPANRGTPLQAPGCVVAKRRVSGIAGQDLRPRRNLSARTPDDAHALADPQKLHRKRRSYLSCTEHHVQFSFHAVRASG